MRRWEGAHREPAGLVRMDAAHDPRLWQNPRMSPDAPASPRREGRLLLLAVSLAVLLQLVLIVLKGQRYYFADTVEYDAAARQILRGLGPGADFPRAPLYPAFVALGYLLGGVGNLEAVRLLQIPLGVALVLLVAWLGRRMGQPVAGLVGALAVAVAPTLAYVSSMVYPTMLYTVLLFTITALAWSLAERPGLGRATALGLLMTLAWLTDPIVVVPLAAVLVWLLLAARGAVVRRVAMVAPAVAVAVLAALPWTEYHRRAYHSPAVPLAKAQYVLYVARHDPAVVGGHAVSDTTGKEFHALPLGRFLRRELGLMREQPAAYLHDYAFEFVHFFQPMPDRIQTSNQYTRTEVRWLVALYFVVVLVLAPIGLLLAAAPLRARLLLALVPLATAAAYALFFSQMRYRIPTEPQLLLLGALGLQRLLPRWRPDRAVAAPAGGGHPG